MKWPLRNGGATYLRNVTDTVLTVCTYILYNTVTVSVHSNNICTSVDVAVGCIAPQPFTCFVFFYCDIKCNTESFEACRFKMGKLELIYS